MVLRALNLPFSDALHNLHFRIFDVFFFWGSSVEWPMPWRALWTDENMRYCSSFDGVLSFSFRFFGGWVWIVPAPAAGGRGLMIQGRRYHHLPGLGGGIISCLGPGGGIIAQILTPNFSPQVITADSSTFSYLISRGSAGLGFFNIWFAFKLWMIWY